MMITSTTNPLVKQLRQLGESSKHRQKHQQILLEGTHLIYEAIETAYPLVVICCTEKWQEKESTFYDRIIQQGHHVEIVADHVLTSMTTTAHPDGVVAAALLQSPPPLHIQRLGIALEGIQDPGNMGTIIRSGVSVGIEGIVVSQTCVDIANPKILRATAGQWFRCPLKPVDDLIKELRYWQKQGLKLVATAPYASQTFWEYDFSQPTILVLGSEGKGLSAGVLTLTDYTISIPTSPLVESLNVGVSASLLLYEAQRQSLNIARSGVATIGGSGPLE